MTTRKRKIRRQRGSRMHGWGVSGQHRDSGMRGGRGNAGRFKHKKTKTSQYEKPGKHGFKNPTTPYGRLPRAAYYGEIYTLFNVSYIGVRVFPEDLLGIWVYRIDLPGEAKLYHTFHEI